MAKVKFILDPIGNTLNIWWGTPTNKDYADESDTSNDVIIYGKDGKSKGVEIIGIFPNELNISKQLGSKRVENLLQDPKGILIS